MQRWKVVKDCWCTTKMSSRWTFDPLRTPTLRHHDRSEVGARFGGVTTAEPESAFILSHIGCEGQFPEMSSWSFLSITSPPTSLCCTLRLSPPPPPLLTCHPLTSQPNTLHPFFYLFFCWGGRGGEKKWNNFVVGSPGGFVISCLCMIILCCPASRNSGLPNADRW